MDRLNVLIVQGGDAHPFEGCSKILKEVYEKGGLANCEITHRDIGFERNLDKYDVVVIYTEGGELTRRLEENICNFVSRGKGIVGLHCASDSFRKNEEYIKMLGSYLKSHHPGTPNFTVEVTQKDHPLARRMKNFNITDEFYILELKDRVSVFLSAFSHSKQEPMAYTKSYGKGRVFYSANGHDERAFRNPYFKNLAIRGLLFASGRWKEEVGSK